MCFFGRERNREGFKLLCSSLHWIFFAQTFRGPIKYYRYCSVSLLLCAFNKSSGHSASLIHSLFLGFRHSHILFLGADHSY